MSIKINIQDLLVSISKEKNISKLLIKSDEFIVYFTNDGQEYILDEKNVPNYEQVEGIIKDLLNGDEEKMKQLMLEKHMKFEYIGENNIKYDITADYISGVLSVELLKINEINNTGSLADQFMSETYNGNTNLSGENKDYKLYSQTEIGVCTFFFGPLCGVHFIDLNYKNLGEENKKVLSFGYFYIIIFIIFLIFNKFYFKLSNLQLIFPIIHVLFVIYYLSLDLGTKIDNHKKQGGKIHSGWKAFGMGILYFLLLGLISLIVSSLITPILLYIKHYG